VAPCVEDRRFVWAAYRLIFGTYFLFHIAVFRRIDVGCFSVLFGEVYLCYRLHE